MSRSIVLILGVLLVGAGCAPTNRADTTADDVSAPQMSAFVGLDGSLTEYALDDVAERFVKGELMGETLIVEQPTMERFSGWLAQREEVPVSDTFGNPIQLRSDTARSFVLWTAGEDGLQNTKDDYFKTYSY